MKLIPWKLTESYGSRKLLHESTPTKRPLSHQETFTSTILLLYKRGLNENFLETFENKNWARIAGFWS